MSWTREVKTFSKACFDSAIDAVFPPRCCVCNEIGRPPICTDCAVELRPLPSGSCEKCAVDNAGDNSVCHWMSAVDMVRGAFTYQGTAGTAVKQLKFARAVEVARPMASFLAPVASEFRFDYVVPVPIHWSRKSHRGFNQAELLARHSGLPFRLGLLTRTKATWPQARSEASVRRSVLQGAFRAKPCPGARVLLMDDVITSGGTAEACAQELKAKGASWVGALAFAIELPQEFVDHGSGSRTP